MSLVFINYRRRDDAYAAAFLDFALSDEFGQDCIFRAGRSIPAGDDYEACLKAAVDQCVVMLVVVGFDWNESFKNNRNSIDWVHEEISRALSRGVRVVPILLSGVSRIHIDSLRDAGWRTDQP